MEWEGEELREVLFRGLEGGFFSAETANGKGGRCL